jgi:glycerol-3-phosphate dehydrogenase
MESLALDSYFAWYLVTNYGDVSKSILDNIVNYKNSPEIALTRAELAYCLANEYVCTLSDFYVRRTGKLYFEIRNINLTKSYIVDDFMAYFGWSEEEKLKYVADFEQEYQDATTYYDKEFD